MDFYNNQFPYLPHRDHYTKIRADIPSALIYLFTFFNRITFLPYPIFLSSTL